MANGDHLSPIQVQLYLKGKWDVTRAQILRDLQIPDAEVSDLDTILANLEADGWITKSFCKTHQMEEFDPGAAQQV